MVASNVNKQEKKKSASNQTASIFLFLVLLRFFFEFSNVRTKFDFVNGMFCFCFRVPLRAPLRPWALFPGKILTNRLLLYQKRRCG